MAGGAAVACLTLDAGRERKLVGIDTKDKDLAKMMALMETKENPRGDDISLLKARPSFHSCVAHPQSLTLGSQHLVNNEVPIRALGYFLLNYDMLVVGSFGRFFSRRPSSVGIHH